MPHVSMRKAFFNMDSTNFAFQLYTRLFAVELTLKDHASWKTRYSHNLDDMITDAVAKTAPGNAANFAGLIAALRSEIGRCWCSDRGGAPTLVRLEAYPELRYLRHAQDFPNPPASSDADIQRALTQADAIIKELNKVGITTP